MIVDFAFFILQSVVLFTVSATLFDVVHFLLHRWQRSRFRLLRMFSSWHQVHHDFLDKNMDIHPELAAKNIWAHLVPEFLTSLAGTLVFFAVMPPWPVITVATLHVALFACRIWEEGIDMNHMSMDRLDGRRSVFGVNPSFHAMHHINPLGFYSSFLNVFDMIFGTAIALRGKRVLLTGGSGAYGSAMKAAIEKMGAKVTTVALRSIANTEAMMLRHYDLLVMCHGLKEHEDGSRVWMANLWTTLELGHDYIDARRGELVPPEIWYVGSEAEVLGISDYAMSKRAMADYAAENWFHSPDVTYRHIVPSAFRSRMGWGLMSPKTAVAWSMFLIRRGFRYIPVTYTGLAFINRLRFVRWPKKKQPATA